MIIEPQKELGNILKQVYQSMNDSQAEFAADEVFKAATIMVQNFGEDRVLKEIDKVKPSDFENVGDASQMFYASMLLFGCYYDLDEEEQMNAAAITVRNFFDISREKQYVLCDVGFEVVKYANKNGAEIRRLLSQK